MKKIVLLLTATVDPSGVILMQRGGVNVRLEDYINAINKWLKHDNLKIVFIENSNFQEENFPLDLKAYHNFEYITFEGQDFPRSLGKGYGEISAIDYALRVSKNLQSADFIIKCNGRYYFSEISKLMSSLQNLDVEVIGNFRYRLDFMDSRVFVFTTKFFQNYFIKYKAFINDSKGNYFEFALAKATHKLLSENNKAWHELPLPILLEGFSGTADKKINSSYLKKIKTLIKYKIVKKYCDIYK